MRKLAEAILAFLRKVRRLFVKDAPPREASVKSMDTGSFMEGIGVFLAEGKEVKMIPKGESMLPFIRGGRDSVVLSRCDRPLEVGDIILAKVGERYVMHRLFAIDGDALTLMGDGNIVGKERCSRKDVLALVKEIHKEDGKVRIPGKARFWRWLRPVRRYILAFYKRVIL